MSRYLGEVAIIANTQKQTVLSFHALIAPRTHMSLEATLLNGNHDLALVLAVVAMIANTKLCYLVMITRAHTVLICMGQSLVKVFNGSLKLKNIYPSLAMVARLRKNWKHLAHVSTALIIQ
jgi:hypothetical protein